MTTQTIAERTAFVLVDLEATGLDEKTDVVLEFGVKLVDPWLRTVAQNSWLVKEENWALRYNAAEPAVKEMHQKSGLIDEIQALPLEYTRDNGQCATYAANYQSYLAWLWLTEECGLEPGSFPMAGSSVHYDRRFATHRLPVFASFFHYRNIDISTLKELCRIFNPDLWASIKNDPRFDKKNAKHRALPDLDASVAELQVYVDNFLFVENGEPYDLNQLALEV